eukprot:gene5952-4261_t
MNSNSLEHVDSPPRRSVVSPPASEWGSIQREFECPLCLSTLLHPRVLACQHCICLKCLFAHGASSNGTHFSKWRRISCPLKCKEKTTVPGGLIHLPRNYIVSKLAESARRIEMVRFLRGESEGEASCEWCSASPKAKPCMTCFSFVCDNCLKPPSLHHFLCSEGKEVSGKMHPPSNNSPPHEIMKSFFSEEDVVECLRFPRQERNLPLPEVDSIDFSYMPVTEYTVKSTLSHHCSFPLRVYHGSSFQGHFSCNTYWDENSEHASIFRLLGLLRAMARRTTAGLQEAAIQLLSEAKRLVPSVSRSTGTVESILPPPSGYQFLAFHLLWVSRMHLFVVYHLFYPLTASLLYAHLVLVDSLHTVDMPWRGSTADPGRQNGEEGNCLDMFSLGNLRSLWIGQMNLLHSCLADVASAVGDVEAAAGEVENLLREGIFLATQSRLRFAVNPPHISLRFFLKQEDDQLQKANDVVATLLKDVLALQRLSSEVGGDAVDLLLHSGGGECCDELVRIQREVAAMQHQLMFLLWGNHRLHYSVISGIVAKSVLNDPPSTFRLPLFLESCYGVPFHPYEVLRVNLLLCIKDLKEMKPSKGLWMIVPSWKADLVEQLADARKAVESSCKVSCFANAALERLDAKCTIQLSAAWPIFGAGASSLRMLSLLDKRQLSDLTESGSLNSCPWLKGLETFVVHFLRIDLGLDALHRWDRQDFPLSTFFGRAWREKMNLDVTLPSPALDNVGLLNPEAKEKDATASILDPYDHESGLQSILNALEAIGMGEQAAQDVVEMPTVSSPVPLEMLTVGVQALQSVAFPNWCHGLWPRSGLDRGFSMDAYREIKVPFFTVRFTVGGRAHVMLFNAHTGENRILPMQKEGLIQRWLDRTFLSLPINNCIPMASTSCLSPPLFDFLCFHYSFFQTIDPAGVAAAQPLAVHHKRRRSFPHLGLSSVRIAMPPPSSTSPPRVRPKRQHAQEQLGNDMTGKFLEPPSPRHKVYVKPSYTPPRRELGVSRHYAQGCYHRENLGSGSLVPRLESPKKYVTPEPMILKRRTTGIRIFSVIPGEAETPRRRGVRMVPPPRSSRRANGEGQTCRSSSARNTNKSHFTLGHSEELLPRRTRLGLGRIISSPTYPSRKAVLGGGPVRGTERTCKRPPQGDDVNHSKLSHPHEYPRTQPSQDAKQRALTLRHSYQFVVLIECTPFLWFACPFFFCTPLIISV